MDLASLRHAQAALAARPLSDVMDSLVALARWLCEAQDGRRRQLVEEIAAATGLSRVMIDWGLLTTAGAWLGPDEDPQAAMRSLLEAELTYPASLDGWVRSAKPGEEMRWVPVPIALQILAGNVFASPIQQLFAGCLARTGQVLKPASTDGTWMASLHARLAELDANLAAAVQVVPLPRESEAIEPLLEAADVITVAGQDYSIQAISTLVKWKTDPAAAPEIVRFGERVSAAYVARYHWEEPSRLAQVAEALAIDVCAYGQRGCLSPLAVFIEDCLPSDLPQIAGQFFEALQRRAFIWKQEPPPRHVRVHRRVYLDRRRMAGDYVLADANLAVVVSAASPTPYGSGANILLVAPVGFPQGVLERLAPARNNLGTLGVALHPAVPLKGFRQSSGLFGKGPSGEPTGPGFNRLCRIGEMQTPRIDEPHDGRPRVRLFLRRETRTVG